MDSVSLQVFWVALGTCLATGLGALPFAFRPTLPDRWNGLASALASGMMISASVFTLAGKALQRGNAWLVLIGLLAGALFFDWTARWLEGRDWKIENLDVADSRKSVLVLSTMFIHSIPEGMAVGIGYATGELQFGLLLAVAIAIHNIPEGIAVSIPLRARGVSVARCAIYAILTSASQPIMAVPSYWLVSWVQPLLPLGLGFAGGAMILIVLAEFLPESFEHCTPRETAWAFMVGLLLMLGLTSGLGI